MVAEDDDEKVIFFLMLLRSPKPLDFHQISLKLVDGDVLSSDVSYSFFGSAIKPIMAAVKKDTVENLYNEVKRCSKQSIRESAGMVTRLDEGNCCNRR